MLTRIINIFDAIKQKAQSVWSEPAARKEMLMDVAVIAPYVVTDVLLYYSSYLNFLASLASDPKHPENEDWYTAAYYTGVGIASLLASGLFLAFSDTTGRMLGIPKNKYQDIKYPLRRVLGVPAALSKVFTGDVSLYTYLAKQLDKKTSIGISCFFAVCAVPALTSFLWSNHSKAKDNGSQTNLTEVQKSLRIIKMALAYLTTTCYAIDVGFVYFHSALNLGKNMGIIDHELDYKNNSAELAGFVVTCTGSIIESVAVYLAFARLNANMLGLISNDEGAHKECWPTIENSKLKKAIGSFAVLFKVFNTAASGYNFFKTRMPLGANIAFVGYSSLGGLFAQSGLLISDPLGDPDKRPQQSPEDNQGLVPSLPKAEANGKDHASQEEVREERINTRINDSRKLRYSRSLSIFSPERAAPVEHEAGTQVHPHHKRRRRQRHPH